MIAFGLILAAALAAPGPIELRVGALPATPYVPHVAGVTVLNPGAMARSVTLDWILTQPGDVTRSARAVLEVPPGGSLTRDFRYELYVDGEHRVRCVARADGRELARWEGRLNVMGSSAAPLLFPNAWRQILTVSGGLEVRAGFGALQPAGPGAWRVRATGAAPVGWRQADDGRATRLVRVPPRPDSARAITGIDAQNRLTRRGRPWFPLGAWTRPLTRAGMRELRGAGFDLAGMDPQQPATARALLDAFRAEGLSACLFLQDQLQFAEGDSLAKQRALAQLVRAVGGHPALALWASMDEPAWSGSPAAGLQAGYEELRRLDRRRPVWTNHAPRNPVQMLAWYNQATDIAGSDIYPVPPSRGHSDLPDRTLAVVGDETAKSIASVHGEKPVLMVLQGFAWAALDGRDTGAPIYPTFAQSRFMAYDAIVAGARGLWWFLPGVTPRPSRFWSDLKSLVSELRAVAPLLEAPSLPATRAARVEPGNAGVRLSERVTGGHSSLLVVNRSDREQAVRIAVPGRAGIWRALFGDPAPRQEGARLVVTLEPWGVRVLTTDAGLAPRRRDFSAEWRGLARATGGPRTAAPVVRGNALRNPSFEEEAGPGRPTGWDLRDPSAVRRDVAVRRSGEASLRLEADLPGLHPLAVQYGVPAEGGRAWRLSGWMRSDTPGVKTRLYAEWVLDGQFHTFASAWFQPGSAWARGEVVFRSLPDPQGGLYVVLQIEGPGRAWFDDVVLEKAE